MSLIGKTIYHYKILEKIGSGGMGEVYKAQDTNLDRFVALKFLPSYFSEDAAKKKRFIQEAKAASALDHPNICTIYEINETEDGQMYIAMGYYEGETLKLAIDNWQLTIDNSIDIAIQIAEGLNRAHQKGIVHRDIKPANIMVTEEGMVKILDFGVAKMADIKLTKTDSTLGTIAYMSPEQVRSEEVDQRADIWSLGVILYEMLSGQLPFSGDQEHAVMYAILNRKPEPISNLRVDIPEIFQPIIDRALNKDREARYAEVEEFISDLKQEGKTGPRRLYTLKKLTRRIRKPPALYITGLAILVILAGFIIFNLARKPTSMLPAPRHTQLTISGNIYWNNNRDNLSLSPDGQFIAYGETVKGAISVMVQDVAGGQPLEILSGISYLPNIRWSPDGSEIMFSASETLYIYPRLGGKAQRISYYPFNCWSPDGAQIAGASLSSQSITFLDKTTGDEIRTIPLNGFQWLNDIDWSPGGDRLVFLTLNTQRTEYTIWTVKIDGTQQKKVVESDKRLSSPRWAVGGEAIYYLQSAGNTEDLMKIKVSPTDGRAGGEPRQVQTGLTAGSFAVSQNNKKLSYIKYLAYGNLWHLTLEAAQDSTSVKTQQLTHSTLWAVTPRISPSEEKVAFAYGENIHVMPVEGGKIEQVTFLDSVGLFLFPCWSPDGKEIAFRAKGKIWLIPATGGTPRVFEHTDASIEVNWAPGREILYQRPGDRNFHFLNPQSGEERPLIENDSVETMRMPRYSPDGQKVAVYWNRAGTDKDGIWLISLTDSSQTLLQKGRFRPLEWSANGKWIYCWNATENQIIKVANDGGKAQALVKLPFESIPEFGVSLTPDGKHIICTVREVIADVWLIENFDPEVE